MDHQFQPLDEYMAQFLSILAFELRGRISFVLGFSQLLKAGDKSFSEAERLEMITVIEEKTRDILTFVYDIEDAYKVGLDIIELNFEKLHLVNALQQAISSKAEFFATQQPPIEVEQLWPDDVPSIWADELRLSQIIDKLLLVVLKSIEDNKITIEISSQENGVVTSISTVGTSIPTEIEALPQTPALWRMPYQDWNLGISRYLVEKHGGRLKIDNQAGKGPKITFTLPIYKGEQEND